MLKRYKISCIRGEKCFGNLYQINAFMSKKTNGL